MTSSQLPALLERYAPAWAQLRAAEQARAALIAAWNQVDPDEAMESWVSTKPDGSGELQAASYVTDAAGEGLDEQAAVFLRSVKQAMDVAVHATASIVCLAWGPVDATLHTMPLTATITEFAALIPQGRLLGLRPDQVRVLEQFQPFATGSAAAALIGSHMQHLAGALERLDRGDRLVCSWASHTGPEVVVPEGASLLSCTTEPDGPLAAPRPLIHFRVDPPDAAPNVRIRPNVALDPVIEASPWPTNLDDNAVTRTARILVVVRHLIEALERSVSTPTFIQRHGRIDDLAPVATEGVWKPVVFNSEAQEADALQSLTDSDLGLASVRTEDGSYTLLRLDDDGQIVGREIPEATPPEPSMAVGPGTEAAALSAAARWGLPDFVFHPLTVAKGTGFREIGDGTLVSGRRGITLQVKARDGATADRDREVSWLQKKAGEGLRQAYGTIRMLAQRDVALTNFRGRELPIPGDQYEWAPVVILDHPNPPDGVTPEHEPDRHGLIITRRDWEFLWDQLRSVTAVIEYAHRVAGDRIELGTEVARYYDLAARDERTAATPMEPWMIETGAVQLSGPTLPRDPANTSDTIGHLVFLQILNDIAATDFGGDELIRLEVLSLIDQVWVGHRAELGRTLLRRIDHCALAPPDTLRAQHRLAFIGGGKLQLSFSVYSHLSGYHREVFQTWVLHRRQTFLQASGATGPDLPWTVAVLLTPRPDGGRLWDTTVLATQGEPAYDNDAYAEIGAAFALTAGRDDAVD